MRFTIRALYVTLAAQVVALTALVVFEETRGSRLATQIATINGDHSSTAAQAVVGDVTAFAVLIMLLVVTFFGAASAYLTWLVRARQANDRAAAAAPVLAGWFVPVVNLAAPLVLVDDVWKNSRPPYDRRTRWLVLIAAWWLAFLTAAASIFLRLSDPSADTLTGLGIRELALVCVAALLCAMSAREIARIQTSPSRARVMTPAQMTSAPL
ncbi:MAG: DUF4328 domain-containing protein [Thermoactinospora sp.]|nr:DUF4328 domain-containing protein [Thermoactinospora sp.]